MAFRVVQKRPSFLKIRHASVISSATINTENLRVIEKPSLSSAKRGTGYRSSFNGTVCTVFGASGFMGPNVVSVLGKSGIQLMIPHRCTWEYISPLRTASDLGQMQFCDFHLEDEDSIRAAVKYSDVVVNLIGRDHDTWNFKLEKVHIDGARRIAKICREMGVKKLIHTSAINASPNPPEKSIKGGSRFMKTKWYGEQAVREEFPDAIIIRPSETYGHLDRYFNCYGFVFRLIFRTLYLYEKGLNTIKQPVYVGDVAHGIKALVERPLNDVAGKTYQFVGPRRYVLNDLMHYIYFHMDKDAINYGFKIEDSRFSVMFRVWMEFYDKRFLVNPRAAICWEKFEMENLTDAFDENLPTLRDLGVNISIIDNHVWGLTRSHMADKTYELDPSEFQQPPGPPIVGQI